MHRVCDIKYVAVYNQMYELLHGTYKTEYGGAGVGLTMVK